MATAACPDAEFTDRPRVERRPGMTVLYDRQAGYCRELSLWEMAALAKQLNEQIELAVITAGKIPEFPSSSGP